MLMSVEVTTCYSHATVLFTVFHVYWWHQKYLPRTLVQIFGACQTPFMTSKQACESNKDIIHNIQFLFSQTSPAITSGLAKYDNKRFEINWS